MNTGKMVSMNKPMAIASSVGLALAVSAALAAPQPTAPGTSAKGGTIQGHVRDNRGKPIVQAQVVIMKTGETTATDKQGAYLFTGEDSGLYVVMAQETKHRPETLTVIVQPGSTVTLDLSLVEASHIAVPLAKGKKAPTAIISVITSQGHRVSPPDPIANGPLNPFQGDLGLHPTARSR